MIDKWFKNDLRDIYEQHTVAVFIDESGDAEFLLKTLGAEYTIQQANTDLEELHVKYLVEKAQPTREHFLLYTRTKKDDLKFIREYCETCGCLEIRYLQNYIKDKVHQTLNLNINLPMEELIAAAKVSVGKTETYWMDICHKGAAEIFDLSKELLPFLHDPNSYATKYDEQLLQTFYNKVNDLLEQDYLSKPGATLAGEVVNAMLDGLAKGSCHETLESVYVSWLDSVTFRDSFCQYLDSYTLSSDLDVWNVSVHHPFRQLDERWLAEIGAMLSEYASITPKLAIVRQRNQSKQAQALGIYFWEDVITLLEFDPKDIAYLSSFEECVEFYQKHFCKIDTAIRNLYSEFLHKKELLEPFQDLYKQHVSVFFEKWFKYWSDYKETQTGILQRFIKNAGVEKTAVIVGDGVCYEIAELVAANVKGSVHLEKNAILADIPSETENNMSRIYKDNGTIEPIQSNREKYLTAQNPDFTIDFVRMDAVTDEAFPGQFLICTHKDIDDMGEKLQQKALKYFPETIDFFAEKIMLLLASGYTNVYLITDHGFVLTGLLCEADKVSVSMQGECYKAERYIRSIEKQSGLPHLIEVAKSYKQFNYLYFSKNMNPFKTVGAYGFSHGGITPQEIITPCFCWKKSDSDAFMLSVSIDNKNELKDVTGELYTIYISGERGGQDIFSQERRVYLVFFVENKLVNTSDVFTIRREEMIKKEYAFDGNDKIEIQVLDATSKKLLDKATATRNHDRDLGGL